MTVSTPKGPREAVTAQLPFLLVLAVVAVGIVLIVMYHWRDGATLIGGALLLAAGLRALLPDENAGLIAVRGRGMDVFLYSGFGVFIVYVAVTIQGGPFE